MIRWWKNLLKRLAESNRKNFGSERLDCCNLNKNQSGRKTG
ncbi:LDCC motif putative metal-binding protein [Proteiniclasticum sp.]|nr:LDCC motif putative metal-binding protein [Proteiniclasticum sp.]